MESSTVTQTPLKRAMSTTAAHEENKIQQNDTLDSLEDNFHWLSSLHVLNNLVSGSLHPDFDSFHEGRDLSKSSNTTSSSLQGFEKSDDFTNFGKQKDYENIRPFSDSHDHSQQIQGSLLIHNAASETVFTVDNSSLSKSQEQPYSKMSFSNIVHQNSPTYHELYNASGHDTGQFFTSDAENVVRKYPLQANSSWSSPRQPKKNSSQTDKKSKVQTDKQRNINVPKLPPPPTSANWKGRQSGGSNRNTTERQRSKEDFQEFNLWNPVVLRDDDLVIHPSRSGRRSAPVNVKAGLDDSEFQGENVALSDIADGSSRPRWSSSNKFTGENSAVPSPSNQLFQERPHSVATSIFLNNIIYDQLSEEPLQHGVVDHERKNGFLTNYGSIAISSLTGEYRAGQTYNASYGSTKSNDSKTAFKTTTSASPLSATPLSITSYESQVKTGKWKSVFTHKKTKFHQMPIDDSMDFGTQPSLEPALRENKSSKNIQDDGSNDVRSDPKNVNKSATDVGKPDAETDTKQETRTAVYSRRWYLLFLFSLSALLWNAVWSTWGPIAQSAKVVYDWTDGDIAMFTWLGNIPFLITMFPSAYLMDVTGMRPAMIVACGFMLLGAGFRCIPSDTETATWLIRVGQFLNGMAGTIPNSGPALLSALWFPPSQRASATAISTVAGYMGASISFVIGPLLVPEPSDLSPVNSSDQYLSSGKFQEANNGSNTTSYQAQQDGIMTILYGECALAGLLFILVLIYFPSKPPLPPSISASIPREKYLQGLKLLIRNKQFWVCALAFSVPIGVYEAWQVILDVILDYRGISQETAGWLDFYATLGGCVSGLLVSRFADFFTRQMKLFLLVFYFFASVAILWFILVVFNIIPFDHVSIYAAIIIAGVFLDGGGPLFFELTIEVSYPVGEGVTSGFTQMMCAAAGIVFLSVVQIEALGKEWMNWCFFGCVAIAIPLLFFINTTYGRADIDDNDGDVSEDDEVANNETETSNDKTSLLGSSHF